MTGTLLREAQMILDVTFGEGGDGWLRNGNSWLWAGDKICSVFGGYTVDRVCGCWMSEGAPVIDTGMRFRVGLPLNWMHGVQYVTPVDWDAFCKLATILAAGQDTVYVVSPEGVAEILNVPKEAEGEHTFLRKPRLAQEAGEALSRSLYL